jgi:hypothetical protein
VSWWFLIKEGAELEVAPSKTVYEEKREKFLLLVSEELSR